MNPDEGTPTQRPQRQAAGDNAERVTIGQVPDWITLNELDESYRPPISSADATLLISAQHHASRNEAYVRVARRLETISAVQESSIWRCDFDPATQHVVIHSLSVRRNGIDREHAEPGRLRFLQREENLESHMIDGTVTVIVTFEDVRIGDVLDTSFTVHSRPRMFPQFFSRMMAIPTGSYTRLFQLSVRFPPEMPMQWKTDSEKIKRQESVAENGETIWKWEVENFAPRFPEPAMPPWHFHGRFIQISSFASWAEVSEGIRTAWREDMDDSELEKYAAEFGACATLEERAEMALRFVQDEIRYLSLNTELGGQIPSAPGVVLRRRFGDCKDKSFLLAHLLRKLGIPARPVLVNAALQHRVAELLPSPNCFNHAVIEYEINGERRWADATIPLQGGGALQRYLPSFGVGLPIAPGVTELEPISCPDAAIAHSSLHESFYVDTDANVATIHVVVCAKGAAADSLRRDIGMRGAHALSEHRLNWYRTSLIEIDRTGDLQTRDDRARNEITLGEMFLWRKPLRVSDEPGVCCFQHNAHFISSALAFPDAENRLHPLAVPYPLIAEHRIECITGAHTRTDKGEAEVAAKAFNFEVTVASKGRHRVYEYEYRSFTDHVDAEGYPEHRRHVIAALKACQVGMFMRSGSRMPKERIARIEVLPPVPADVTDDVSAATPAAPYGIVAPVLQGRAEKTAPKTPSQQMGKSRSRSSGSGGPDRSLRGYDLGKSMDDQSKRKLGGFAWVIIFLVIKALFVLLTK